LKLGEVSAHQQGGQIRPGTGTVHRLTVACKVRKLPSDRRRDTMDQQSARRALMAVAVAFAVVMGGGGGGALLRPPPPEPQWGHPCEEISKGYCLVENAPIKESDMLDLIYAQVGDYSKARDLLDQFREISKKDRFGKAFELRVADWLERRMDPASVKRCAIGPSAHITAVESFPFVGCL
jgi:hypothetical protein